MNEAVETLSHAANTAALARFPGATVKSTDLGEEIQPPLAEGHRTVADGAWMGVELAEGGDEEAPAGEDALLDVVEEPLDVGA